MLSGCIKTGKWPSIIPKQVFVYAIYLYRLTIITKDKIILILIENECEFDKQ